MQDRIKIIMLTVVLTFLSGVTVWGYTGSGTNNNPYVVSAESGLSEILSQNPRGDSWTYIAIDSTVGITKTIVAEKGKYRIYAIGGNQTIRRSPKTDAAVNNLEDSKYCVRVKGSAQVVFGYDASDYQLILNGNADAFSTNRQVSGFINTQDSSVLTIGKNCVVFNVNNNKIESDSAPIKSESSVIVNGEISKCKGINGGAIKATAGTVTINSTAMIHNCSSMTEGGAIHCSNGATLQMNDGQIYDCVAAEEGGAIFIKGNSRCNIVAGTIKGNSAQSSAGGVFAGYGATLVIGTSSGTGPNIIDNSAKGSGGGVRCDGGDDANAGGITYLFGGYIANNYSGKLGGGIACGNPGNNGQSKFIMKNTKVVGNTSESSGGGIWLPEECVGVASTTVYIYDCTISNNISKEYAGGIMIHCDVTATNNVINNNKSNDCGGAIFIAKNACFTAHSGTISGNVSMAEGSGVYVKGQYRIRGDGYVDNNNYVYLTTGTYIDVIGQLNKNTGYIAVIDSQEKANGTKLVRANYTGSSASTELYYSGNLDDEYIGKAVSKKYQCVNLYNNQLLRPSEKVNGYNGQWIIISEKYLVDYSKNTAEYVENMPGRQTKFWNEDILLSANKVERNGYVINEDLHWNLNENGSGDCVKPGQLYSYNGNKILYAQWLAVGPKELTIIANDRYYVVGQNIILGKDEILKKVIVEDDLKSGAFYDVKVIEIVNSNNESIVKESNIDTKKYLNTNMQEHYTLTLFASNSKGNLCKETKMNIYILDPLLNNGTVRFISNDYFNTLGKQSKWNMSFRSELKGSLTKKKGEGIYFINLSNEDVKSIKANMKDNDYKISHEMNSKLSEKW